MRAQVTPFDAGKDRQLDPAKNDGTRALRLITGIVVLRPKVWVAPPVFGESVVKLVRGRQLAAAQSAT